jgi:hypothetical protein
MPGLVPGIHVFRLENKTWMAGTSPAMTILAQNGHSHNFDAARLMLAIQ